jgi:hypothetical protein
MNRTAIFAQCTTPDTYLAASPDGRRFFPISERPPALRHYPGLRLTGAPKPPPRPELPKNTTRERARRARQAAAWAAGAPRRERRASHRRVVALLQHYRREYDARQTWAQITLRQRCAKVAEYREALKQYARLREFNRLIREHNARHSPYEGLL